MSFQYLTAAKLVSDAEKGKSLKSICASMPKLGKMEYALAIQTLKFKPVLFEMMTELNISAKTLEVKPGLLLVMLYEMVFGTGKISGGGVVKRKLMEYRDKLLQLRDSRMIGKTNFDELLSDTVQAASQLPLYVRINQAKMEIANGLVYLQEHYDDQAVLDSLIPSLVILPPNCKGIAQDKHIKDGSMIIQDKASCFPAQILYNEYCHSTPSARIGSRCDFIDACAAPGNKTSHLAALLNPNNVGSKDKKRGRDDRDDSPGRSAHSIFAFDKSPQRIKIIEHRMKLLGVDHIIKSNHRDFLSVNIDDPMYGHVEYLLLDPSCSGSGIVRNIERISDVNASEERRMKRKDNTANDLEDEELDGYENEDATDGDKEKKRLLKLQAFQTSVILKAMSFHQAHTISYSTCSIHEEENEQVVANVLNSEMGKNWEVMAPAGFDTWTHRGISTEYLPSQTANKLIRCNVQDGTNGFFVCLFKKRANSTALPNREVSPAVMNTRDLQAPSQKKARVERSMVTGVNHNEEEDNSASQIQVGHPSEIETIQITTKSTKAKKSKKVTPSAPASIFSSRFSVSKSNKRKFGKK